MIFFGTQRETSHPLIKNVLNSPRDRSRAAVSFAVLFVVYVENDIKLQSRRFRLPDKIKKKPVSQITAGYGKKRVPAEPKLS